MNVLAAGADRERPFGAVAGPNDIFFHLDARHVYYDASGGYLYFAAGPQDLVTTTLQAVLTGFAPVPPIEQLHLDSHRYFSAARRVAIRGSVADAVLVALRLVGIRTTIA